MYFVIRNARVLRLAALATLSLTILLAPCGCESTKPTAGETAEATRRAGEDDFSRGVNLPPTPMTLLAMSRVLVAQGRQDEAIYVLERVIREHADYLPAYVELARVQLAQGQPDAAIATLTAGQRVAPRDALLANDTGMCRLLQGDYQRASACFEVAAAEAPNNVRYQTNRALALGMLGRYDECLKAYEQVAPPDEAHENLAIICRARHDKSRADQEGQTAKQVSQAGK